MLAASVAKAQIATDEKGLETICTSVEANMTSVALVTEAFQVISVVVAYTPSAAGKLQVMQIVSSE